MNIFLTLDYELYLGQNTGTPQNCLIRPMNDLCKLADKHGIKLVIFVDAGYLLKMAQGKHQCPQLQKDYEMVSNHIRALAAAGHDIELHLHPQWYKAQWNGKTWKLDFEYYKLSDLPEPIARSYFREAKNYLESLLSKPIRAFRAGGYSIQTFPDYARLFRENGIIVDSSARSGAKTKTEFQEYDYTRLPSASLYRFEENLEQEAVQGQLWELPISTFKKNSLAYLWNKRMLIRKGTLREGYGDGKGIGRPGSRLKQFVGLIKKTYSPQIIPASLDGFNAYWLPYIFRQMQNKKAASFTVIGHPKAFTSYSLQCLETFLNNLDADSKIRTISELVDEIYPDKNVCYQK